MKKLLIGLLLGICATGAEAITYQSVRASTATVLTPTIQVGAMNLSSGTITNLSATNTNVTNTLTTKYLTATSTAGFVGVTGSTISYSSATFTNANVTGTATIGTMNATNTSATNASSSNNTIGILTVTSSTTLRGNVGINGNIDQALTITSSTTHKGATAFLGNITQPMTVTSSATFTAGVSIDTVTVTSATITTLYNPLVFYRRPVLQYNSGTVVNLESGMTGTSGQSAVLFPDGNYYKESTAAGIQCDLTKRANYGSNLQAGLTPGFVLTVNTWYSFYAVKSTSTVIDFAVVATTITPTQGNYATLNTTYGTNSWVYLGVVPYGNGGNVTNAVPKFAMAGNAVTFYNPVTCSVAEATPCIGLRLATTASASSLTWSYALGITVGTQIPDQIVIATVASAIGGGTIFQVTDSASAIVYQQDRITLTAGTMRTIPFVTITQGLKNTASAATTQDIELRAYIDSVLGVGANPQL